jgi:two-component system sensor histidine kinase/response regulator
MKQIFCIESKDDRGRNDTLFGMVSTALPLFTTTRVAHISEALDIVQEKKQGLILVDMSHVTLESLAALDNLIRFRPQIALIAVLPRADYALAKAALEAGAHDTVAHPLTEGDLRRTLLRQHERIQMIQQEIQRTRHDVALRISSVLPHEFRTPLNGLIGFINLLRQDALLEDEKPMAYRYLESSINRLHQTAEKFLLYAELEQLDLDEHALESPRASLSPSVSSSSRFATYGMTSLATEIAQETLAVFDRVNDIIFHLDGSEYAVQMRAQHVRFVITELLTNACKFSESRTPIELTMKHDKEVCTLTIRDNGCGFETNDLQRISAFNQFGRERFEQQGVGFGLPIVRKILSLYGGKFDIQSKRNEGTCVTVVVPLAPLSQTEEGYASVQYITMHPLQGHDWQNN